MESLVPNSPLYFTWAYENAGVDWLREAKSNPFKNHVLAVFVHGFLEDHSMWKGIIPRGIPALLIDLPGHGNAPSWSKEASLSMLAEQMWNGLDAFLPENTKLHLIGHSMGGYFAVELAKRRPEQVQELCFWQSTFKADSEEKKEMRCRAIEALEANQALYVGGMIRGLFSEENKEKCSKEINKNIEVAKQMKTSDIRASLEAMKDRDDSSLFLQNADFPCTLVHGELDPLFSLDRQVKESKEINAKHVYTVPDCGHMMHIENPKAALEIIHEMLGQ